MKKIEYKVLEKSLQRLEGWYSTWFTNNDNGRSGVGGLIATLWGSSWYACIPHILNTVGVIRGLCYRANDENGEHAVNRASNLIEFLLRCQDPTTGTFLAGWGDIPFKKTGLIHQTFAVTTLLSFFKVTQNAEVRECAERATKILDKCDSWNVINQVLRHLETIILMCESLELPKDNKHKKYLEKKGKWILSLQFKDGEMKGAFPQALSGETVFSCYQGKCLIPLVNLGTFLSDDAYIDSAIRLGKFIKQKLLNRTDQGLLLNYCFEPSGDNLKLWRKLYKLRRLLPFSEKWLRKGRISAIHTWRFSEYPVWIARSADTALGFYKLYEVTNDSQWLEISLNITNAILLYQTPIGGIRNTLGFFGIYENENLVWQDVAPITRWNAYVIELLHYLLKGRKVLMPIRPSEDIIDRVNLKDNQIYEETVSTVSLKDNNNRILWTVNKKFRWGRPRIPYMKWDEGDCQRGNLTGKQDLITQLP